MRVTINGQEQQVEDGLSIAALLSSLQLKQQQVAVEVNQVLVPREKHQGHGLQEGDELEIVTLVGGG